MSVRRLVCCLLGAWLAGSAFMYWVATGNFRSVDRMLEKPAPRAAELIGKLGAAETRMLLRHHVGEINRAYFENWEMAQLALAALVFGLLLFGTSERRFALALALLMGGLVAAMHWGVTPIMLEVGHEVDFLPPGQMTPARARMQAAHGAYGVIEAAKVALGLTLLGWLLIRRRRQVDAVNDADDRHVNR